jgi:LCP family protein required for cell wall assembly
MGEPTIEIHNQVSISGVKEVFLSRITALANDKSAANQRLAKNLLGGNYEQNIKPEVEKLVKSSKLEVILPLSHITDTEVEQFIEQQNKLNQKLDLLYTKQVLLSASQTARECVIDKALSDFNRDIIQNAFQSNPKYKTAKYDDELIALCTSEFANLFGSGSESQDNLISYYEKKYATDIQNIEHGYNAKLQHQDANQIIRAGGGTIPKLVYNGPDISRRKFLGLGLTAGAATVFAGAEFGPRLVNALSQLTDSAQNSKNLSSPDQNHRQYLPEIHKSASNNQSDPGIVPTKDQIPTNSPETPQSELVDSLSDMFQAKRDKRRRTDSEYSKRINPELENNRINFAFIGLDAGQQNQAGEYVTGTELADTIMIISYNTQTGIPSLISIPRDLHAPEVDDIYAGYKGDDAYKGTWYRINATSYYGNDQDMRRILENATGLPVDACIFWDFDKLKNMIDSVGGVDLQVNQKFIEDYQDWFTKFSDFKFNQDGGLTHFNGDEALQYARVRKKDTDIDRNTRQMQVVKALMKCTLSKAKNKVWEVPGIAGNFLKEEGSSRLLSEVNPADVIKLLGQAVLNRNTSAELNVLLSEVDQISPVPLNWKDGEGFVHTFSEAQLANAGTNQNEYWQLWLDNPNVPLNKQGLPVDPQDPLEYWEPLRTAISNNLKN